MTWRVSIELQFEASDLLEVAGFLKGLKEPSDFADKITGFRAEALTPDEAIQFLNFPE